MSAPPNNAGDANQPPNPPLNPPPNQQPPNNDEPPRIGDGPHNEINAATIVRLPMPKIVRDNIELWFLQLEHWFTVSRIASDSVRFSTVVSALDANLLQQIYEVVRNPPAAPASKYDAIRNAVIRNFSESEQRRAQQFVSGLQLGDKKPSHLLNELRRIGGEAQDEKLLKVLWMNRLPIQVQTCLAAVTQPLTALAELADSVMETFRVGSSNEEIHGVNSGASTSSNAAAASSSSVATNNAAKSGDSHALSKLSAQIAQLAKEIAKMHLERNNNGQRGRSTERTASTSRPRSATPAPANEPASEDDGRCWYHRTYGSDARKCRDPCTQQKN